MNKHDPTGTSHLGTRVPEPGALENAQVGAESGPMDVDQVREDEPPIQPDDLDVGDGGLDEDDLHQTLDSLKSEGVTAGPDGSPEPGTNDEPQKKGADMAAEAEQDTEQKPPAITLVFGITVDGQDAGIREFDQEMITIGKGLAPALQIPDPMLADMHCAVQIGDEGKITILDFGSEAGTLLNGKSIDSGPIHDGDVIKIGRTEIVFSIRWLEDLAKSAEESAPSEDASSPGDSRQEMGPISSPEDPATMGEVGDDADDSDADPEAGDAADADAGSDDSASPPGDDDDSAGSGTASGNDGEDEDSNTDDSRDDEEEEAPDGYSVCLYELLKIKSPVFDDYIEILLEAVPDFVWPPNGDEDTVPLNPARFILKRDFGRANADDRLVIEQALSWGGVDPSAFLAAIQYGSQTSQLAAIKVPASKDAGLSVGIYAIGAFVVVILGVLGWSLLG